jgi:hypothetical protein
MRLLVIGALALASGAVMAQESHHRSGYVTKDGVYVAPSYATNPNATKLDNYSTKGNYNPYTGQAGTVDPYRVAPPQPAYSPYTYQAPPAYKPYQPPK